MTQSEALQTLLERQIAIIDGAMGTMIQRRQLSEDDFRGKQFKNHPIDLKGNNDLLSITQPETITDIHQQYLQAGANIIETNTFNAQAISLADYKMEHLASDINREAVACARNAVRHYLKEHPEKNGQVFVAGAIGPMNKMLSLSPDVNRPGYRAVTFDEVARAYYEQIQALAEGGADILLIETVFDTLNAKAALYAAKQYFQTASTSLPIMVSGTITDASGRTLSGQTLEAFVISVEHAAPIAIGLNCALGAKEMKPHIAALSQFTNAYVSAYPNAGLPNPLGEYDQSPEEMAAIVSQWAQNGWINLIGGCCGTTPEHIRAISHAVAQFKPRTLPSMKWM